MIQYTPENQLTIEEFKTPFEVSLSSENRWVKLAEIVNWDVFSQKYIKIMDIKVVRKRFIGFKNS